MREFENIVVIKSLEMWAGLSGLPLGWLIARPAIARQIEAFRPSARAGGAATIAALATLDDLAYVRATVRRILDEKSHLFRTLRKLNMLQPLPSWANFSAGARRTWRCGLVSAATGAARYFRLSPDRCHASQHLRIAAATPETTRMLKEALIELALELP
ncbi:MAG: hypothetical protein R2845_00340 [Thermomicrobiales bacterium]